VSAPQVFVATVMLLLFLWIGGMLHVGVQVAGRRRERRDFPRARLVTHPLPSSAHRTVALRWGGA